MPEHSRRRPSRDHGARGDRARRLRRADLAGRPRALRDSLNTEAHLHELGEQIAAGEIVEYLSTRLGLVDWRKQHPEIADVDVVPPIVIVGQARTGTTILHDLLAQDPANRVPLTWEVDRPLPPPETATYDTDPRIAASQELLDGVELVIPGFQAMHPMGARCRRSACA